MANFKIITNSPLAKEKYPEVTELFDTDVLGIFVHCRDMVHFGAKLINHPLAGSIKPNESPYKSIVLSDEKNHRLDVDSLQLIEGAMAVLHKLPKKNIPLNERMRDDFMVIDLDLLDSAIKALPHDYHF